MTRPTPSSVLFTLALLSCAACGSAPGSDRGDEGNSSADHGDTTTAIAVPDGDEDPDDAGAPPTAIATPDPWTEDAGPPGEVDASPPTEVDAGVGGDPGCDHGGHGGHGGEVDASFPTEDDAGI